MMEFKYRSITLIVVLYLVAIGNGQDDDLILQEDGVCSPTPRNFMQLFINECNNLNLASCNELWTSFASSFARMNPSDVTPNSYFSYFNMLPINPDPNTSLFWSRTQKLVEMLGCMCASGANIISSANAPATAIVNNVEMTLGIEELRWCGTTDSSSSDGIEYNMQCPCQVSFDFFEKFSVTFAQAARGTMFYLGYGERENGTYSEESFFAKYEIPNLRTFVTAAVIMVVHRKGQGESCGEGTLLTLRQTLESKSIAYSCYDVFGDPADSSVQNCTVDIITSIQEGIEPDNSTGCFRKDMSSALGLHLSALSLLVSVLVTFLVL